MLLRSGVQWLDRCFKMMRVLFLIPVRGGANACGRRSRYHVGINFNTRVVRECALYILVCSPINAGIIFNTRESE